MIPFALIKQVMEAAGLGEATNVSRIEADHKQVTFTLVEYIDNKVTECEVVAKICHHEECRSVTP
jgi:hypothetical protein